MKIFFNRIIGNIYKPHTLIKKIFQKINYRLSINKYDMKFFENEQNIVFKHFGLSRDEGIINLETLSVDPETIFFINGRRCFLSPGLIRSGL